MNLNSWKAKTAIALFFLLCLSTNAQVIKLRSSSMASQTREEGKSWSGWSDLEDSSILITLDVDLQRITVYTRDKQVFDIAEYEGLTEDEDGDEIFSFYCVDNEGRSCRVQYLKLHSQNERKQLYIYYDNIAVLFNVFVLN